MENKNHPHFPHHRKSSVTPLDSDQTNASSKPTQQDAAFDQAFQQQFHQFERTPPTQVWNKVSRRLPLHLLLKRQLQSLSKIAAVLLIGMAITIFYQQKQHTHSPTLLLSLAPDDAKLAASPTTATSPDFVFELKPKRTKNSFTHSKKKPRKHSSDLEELWAEIITENTTELEALWVQSSITPIENLPLELPIALTPTQIQLPNTALHTTEEEFIPAEIEIRIPLRIAGSFSIE